MLYYHIKESVKRMGDHGTHNDAWKGLVTLLVNALPVMLKLCPGECSEHSRPIGLTRGAHGPTGAPGGRN